MKKKVLATVIALMVCATPVLAKQKLLWYTFDPGWAKDEAQGWVTNFAERHDVVVEPVIVPWGDMAEKVTLAVLAGEPPDVFAIGRGWEELGALGILADLRPFIARDQDYPKDQLFDVQLRSKQGPNGEQWVFPADIDLTVLFYSKDLFSQRGVAFPDRDTDWDDWLTQAIKMSWDQDGDGKHDNFAITNYYQPWVWQYMVMANDGWFFNPDKTPNLGSPEARYVYEYQREWFARDLTGDWRDLSHINVTRAPDGFLNGRIAMMCVGPWWGGSIQKAGAGIDWDIAMLPKAPTTGKRPYVLGGSGMAVAEASRNKDLAYQFAKQVIMLEGARIIAKGTGNLVTNRIASREWSMHPTKFPGISRQVLLEAPNYALINPKGVFWDAIYPEYMNNMNRYFRGQVSMDEAISNAEIAMKARLQSLGVLR